MLVTIGGIDVESVFHIYLTGRNLHVRIRLPQFVGQKHGPAVDDSLMEEPFLVGETLGSGKTSVAISQMRQIFLIARQAEKDGCERVEGKNALLVIDRE